MLGVIESSLTKMDFYVLFRTQGIIVGSLIMALLSSVHGITSQDVLAVTRSRGMLKTFLSITLVLSVQRAYKA